MALNIFSNLKVLLHYIIVEFEKGSAFYLAICSSITVPFSWAWLSRNCNSKFEAGWTHVSNSYFPSKNNAFT